MARFLRSYGSTKIIKMYHPLTSFLREFTDNVIVSDNISKSTTRVFTELGILISDIFLKSQNIFKTFTESDITLSDNYSDIMGKGLEFNETINVEDGHDRTTASYSEANQDTDFELNATNKYVGQSFRQDQTNVSGYIYKVKLYLKKSGSPTGNATLTLSNVNGSFGANNRPTTAITTADSTLDVSTLTTSYQLIEFSFTGANAVQLREGYEYGIYLHYPDGDGTNKVIVGYDSSGSTGVGNGFSSADGSTWDVLTGQDLCFYVYDRLEGVTKDITRSISDTTLVSDNIVKSSTRSFLDNVGITELFNASFAYIKTLSDSVNVTESFAKVFGYLKSFTDNVDATDTRTHLLTKNWSFSEIVNVYDKLYRFLNGLLVTAWTKLSRPVVGTWSKISRTVTDWTKIERPED